jgi:hypothetical protein
MRTTVIRRAVSLVFSVLIALLFGAVSAQAAAPSPTVTSVSTGECAGLHANLARWASAKHNLVDPRVLLAAHTGRSDDCQIATVVNDPSLAQKLFGVTQARAINCPASTWVSQGMSIAGVYIGYNEVNVGFNCDGLTAWRNWGPDCFQAFQYGYQGWNDWCGFATEHQWTAEAGNNWRFHWCDPTTGVCGPPSAQHYLRVDGDGNGDSYSYGG